MLIEQSQWSEYLAELSRQAEGYDVSVEVLAPDLGDDASSGRPSPRPVNLQPVSGLSRYQLGGHLISSRSFS
jgi:hypothetical protein